MGQKKVKAVLFDLGDTLINFGKVDAIELFKQGGRLAYDFLQNANQPTGSFESFIRKYLLRIKLYHVFSSIIGRDFDSTQLLRKTAQKKGVRLNDKQWAEFAWCWYEPLSKVAAVEDNIKQTLVRLKEAGLKIGILSNTFINATTLERHLRQLGMVDLFDLRLYSYQFSCRKPNKKIFLAAAEKIQTPPENIIFVGDRLDTDVFGSLRVKMMSVLKKAYTNSKKKIPKGVIRIEKLAELPEIIERINSSEAAMVSVG